ncbi:MAG: glycosyltransferase family 9 protein [Chitinivibrionales bacterium]
MSIPLKTIILSRTDGIGDVVLSLPVAYALKKANPSCCIVFLGSAYTRPLIDACVTIDYFLDWEDIRRQTFSKQLETIRAYDADAVVHLYPRRDIARLMAKAGIPLRIGTMGRLFHWNTCNKLVFVRRKNSRTHEALHNLRLVEKLCGRKYYDLEEIKTSFGLTRIPALEKHFEGLFSREKTSVVLHPCSKGSAREWGLENFTELISILPKERYSILVTGSQEERRSLTPFLDRHAGRIIDLVGACSLGQLIAIISKADALVAVSTGPLHIAAALGKKTIGLYAPKRSISPHRWGPLGINASYLAVNKKCNKCSSVIACECIKAISPQHVMETLKRTM